MHKDVNMMLYNRLIRLPHNAIHSPNIIIYREDCRLGLYDEDYGDQPYSANFTNLIYQL